MNFLEDLIKFAKICALEDDLKGSQLKSPEKNHSGQLLITSEIKSE